jgi:nitroimidazol reductase NimA-like FMN-containing flavoprotein (pyridoxamine 5'-phosphate oxidase superfamily)
MGETRLNTGLEQLDRDECIRLLRTEAVGRLVMIGDHGRLEIFPVNYFFDGDAVLFRTDMGTKLTATAGAPVAFEVDHLDFSGHSVWSVVIHGTAHRSDAHTAQLRLSTWVHSTKPHLAKIIPDEITGRRLCTPSDPKIAAGHISQP